MSGEIKMVGNWKQEIENPLQGALQTSVEICGRSFVEACKHAIILMAKSMASPKTNLTPIGAKKRPVKNNPFFVHLLKKSQYKKMAINKADMRRYYTKTADYLQQQGKPAVARYANQEIRLAKIGRRGLARRSWMWGLRDIGLSFAGSKPIPGVADTRKYISKDEGGFILTNRLNYLLRILPTGWEQIVAEKAGNKIMRQAKIKIERQWKRAMAQKQRMGYAVGQTIGQYFLRG